MSRTFCSGLSSIDTQYILSLLLRSRQEKHFPSPTPQKLKILMYTYRNIFNREFNLSFSLPQKDTCARCEALDMALLSCGGEDKTNLPLEESPEHQEKGENGYGSKRRDKQGTQQSWNGKNCTLGENSTSKDSINIITFDFQQNVFICPMNIDTAKFYGLSEGILLFHEPLIFNGSQENHGFFMGHQFSNTNKNP